MSLVQKHFDKENLHHAYLIEGDRAEIVPDILEFLKSLGIEKGNPDFYYIELDSFKIEDARNLKSHGTEKGFSSGKKIFLISANSFLLEAQNSLLKLFEEPIEQTHFFVVTPDVNNLLRTLVSRFYVVSTRQDLTENRDAEKFIEMDLQNRINFIKELLAEEGEENEEVLSLDSPRSKALKFLNSLELVLHRKLLKNSTSFTLPGLPGGTYADQNFSTVCFEHFFKIREFLRMP